MSLHFTIFVACDLRPDTPPNISEMLKHWIRHESDDVRLTLRHTEFVIENLDLWIMPTAKSIAWVHGICIAEFSEQIYRYNNPIVQGGADVLRDTLTLRQGCIDDTYGDWLQFLMWLAQYSETEGFVGYIQEEYDPTPTLIYFKKKEMFMEEAPYPTKSATGVPWFGSDQ